MSRAWDVRSLRRQVAGLEQQLVQRRRRLRGIAAGIRRKTASRMVSPGVLLVALGVGVALEQAGHRRGWSLPGLLDATSAGLRLLLTLAPAARHPPGETNASVWQRTDLQAGQV